MNTQYNRAICRRCVREVRSKYPQPCSIDDWEFRFDRGSLGCEAAMAWIDVTTDIPLNCPYRLEQILSDKEPLTEAMKWWIEQRKQIESDSDQ